MMQQKNHIPFLFSALLSSPWFPLHEYFGMNLVNTTNLALWVIPKYWQIIALIIYKTSETDFCELLFPIRCWNPWPRFILCNANAIDIHENCNCDICYLRKFSTVLNSSLHHWNAQTLHTIKKPWIRQLFMNSLHAILQKPEAKRFKNKDAKTKTFMFLYKVCTFKKGFLFYTYKSHHNLHQGNIIFFPKLLQYSWAQLTKEKTQRCEEACTPYIILWFLFPRRADCIG